MDGWGPMRLTGVGPSLRDEWTRPVFAKAVPYHWKLVCERLKKVIQIGLQGWTMSTDRLGLIDLSTRRSKVSRRNPSLQKPFLTAAKHGRKGQREPLMKPSVHFMGSPFTGDLKNSTKRAKRGREKMSSDRLRPIDSSSPVDPRLIHSYRLYKSRFVQLEVGLRET